MPPTVSELEAQLARERSEREAEAGEIGRLLARATQAESRVKALEAELAATRAERAELEAEVIRQRHSFAAQLMEQRQALEHLAAAAKPTKNKITGKLDSVASLTSVRTMATELLRLLEKIDEREAKSTRAGKLTEPPRRKPSQPDTVPPRRNLPETLPPRSRTDTPPASRRFDSSPPRPPRT